MRLRKGRLGSGWTSWVRRLGTRGEPASWGPGVGAAWGVLLQRLCRAELELTLGPAGHWGDRRKARREPSPRPPARPQLTPRVGPEGHRSIALHQMRPFKAVFVLETAVRQLGLGARGAGGRSVASRAIAPDESAERQQQGAKERPRSSPGTPPSGPRHLGFGDAGAGGRGRGTGAADGQQGAL